MREILFRGFHPCDGPETIVADGEKIKGKWVEGYYVKRDNRSWIYPAGNQVISKSLARELRPLHSAKSTQKVMREVFLVLPSTVGQWTGKIDKYEKKVFSGDKVYYSHEDRIYSVEWNDSLLRWEGLVGWIAVPLYQFVDSCEVIGTVFDEGQQ